MADAKTMMLARKYDATALDWKNGVSVSVKLDGVPGVYTKTPGHVYARSRQDEPIYSTEHICNALMRCPSFVEAHPVVGELYMRDTPFKDISGKVRAEANCKDLVLYLFDALDFTHREALVYIKQIEFDLRIIGYTCVAIAPQAAVVTFASNSFTEERVQAWFKSHPTIEGLCFREMDSMYQIGARPKQFQKIVREHSYDLRVVSFEEAVSVDSGEPKGMLGRINVEYNGSVIGCGPGKLTHRERRYIWENQANYTGRIAKIMYKPDPSYAALRQPTFQCWRPDKTQPDA